MDQDIVYMKYKTKYYLKTGILERGIWLSGEDLGHGARFSGAYNNKIPY